MFSMLVFGVFNVVNWFNGMMRPGCTGHERAMLLFVAIPLACGVVCVEAGWASALVMSIPVWMTPKSYPDGWRPMMYASVYVKYLILVYAGYALRRSCSDGH